MAITAAIRIPVLLLAPGRGEVRVSANGSVVASGSVVLRFGLSGSTSIGGTGLTGSRGSRLRAGLAMTVSPLLGGKGPRETGSGFNRCGDRPTQPCSGAAFAASATV